MQPGHNTALNLQTLLSRHTSFGCFSHLGPSRGGWTAKSFATCYASDNALVVFIISFIAEKQTIQLFLSLPTTCPPARSPAKPSSAQNRFSNQHLIVDFSPVSGSDISQAQLSSAYPPSPAPVPPFLQSLWKEQVWHSGYQLPAPSQLYPKPPNLQQPSGSEYKVPQQR